jgi:hypothetical protein
MLPIIIYITLNLVHLDLDIFLFLIKIYFIIVFVSVWFDGKKVEENKITQINEWIWT